MLKVCKGAEDGIGERNIKTPEDLECGEIAEERLDGWHYLEMISRLSWSESQLELFERRMSVGDE